MTIMDKRTETSAHLVILVCLILLTIGLFYRFSTEDSYITYRYAQNLVDGEGFVYNPGEKFLGTTAPFYALLLAFFGLLGFPIPYIGGVLSAFSLGMVVILIYLLALKKGYPLVGFLGGLFILLNPWSLQTFGSETFFQIFLIVGAFYFYDQKKYIPTTILCALAFLVRADGIIPAAIIFGDYVIKNKKFPIKEAVLFLLLCTPLFLFYYFNFHTFLPATLDLKQAQYASGLWRKFLPGTLHFAGLLLEENRLLYGFIPLFLIGGVLLITSGRIWLLMASWAILHFIGYGLLKVSFYHWYPIPLVFLLMLMGAFSLNFVKFIPRFLQEDKTKKWGMKIFNQEIKLYISRFKDVTPLLKQGHRLLSFVIMSLIIITLIGGIRAYYKTRRALPFSKLELYTKAGQWMDENSPADSSVAFLEVGYFGYHARRRIIDLVGLVTQGVSEHIRMRDFEWAVRKYRPDYFIYNPEFHGWLRTILDQGWFDKGYREIEKIQQAGYPHPLTVFQRVPDFKIPPLLSVDSSQEESKVPVGEITEGIEIGQTFFCHNNYLTQIKVMLATYDRKNHQDVIFHLKESPYDEKDIYTEMFNASNVGDNNYRSFDFPPIPDSKGKMFYFSFESPQSQPGDAITIWASDKNTYKKGNLHRNGKKSKGDLRFITYFYEYE